jgi:hypothetical protein
MSVLKQAARTREALRSANERAAAWTQAPDREEFFARYFNDVGYVLSSYDRGVVVRAKRSRDLASAVEEVAASVEAKAEGWNLGLVGERNRVTQVLPDPRRGSQKTREESSTAPSTAANAASRPGRYERPWEFRIGDRVRYEHKGQYLTVTLVDQSGIHLVSEGGQSHVADAAAQTELNLVERPEP